MNITLFQSIGIGNIDFSYVFIALIVLLIALIVLTIIQISKTNKLNKKLKKFMTGKNAKSLEEGIEDLFRDNRVMKDQINDSKKDIKNINQELLKVYQKSAINRYNAFEEMGGNLSFCLTMLDKENNGFILNSVHTSSGCYNYLKKIENGKCEIELGEEEDKSLKEALKVGEII